MEREDYSSPRDGKHLLRHGGGLEVIGGLSG